MGGLSAIALLLGIAWTSGIPAAASTAASTSYTPAARGELDCNGVQPGAEAVAGNRTCTDIRGASKANANTWDGRFYDNGHYIGHDEPNTDVFLQHPPAPATT